MSFPLALSAAQSFSIPFHLNPLAFNIKFELNARFVGAFPHCSHLHFADLQQPIKLAVIQYSDLCFSAPCVQHSQFTDSIQSSSQGQAKAQHAREYYLVVMATSSGWPVSGPAGGSVCEVVIVAGIGTDGDTRISKLHLIYNRTDSEGVKQ